MLPNLAEQAVQRTLAHRCRVAAQRLGFKSLYAEQERTVTASLAGRDVLVVLPTGFGKSACYQIPSMILPKPVVLVSPLLALLRDQHEKLLKRDIPVERLDGTVRGMARRDGAAARRRRRLAAGDDHARDARRRGAGRRRCSPRASGSPRSTRRTASPSGATTSVPRICGSASGCASSARRRSWR